MNGISQLKIIVSIAKGHGDHAIAAAASITEALSYLHRSYSTDSIEQTQRALAAARSAQLDPVAQAVPQLAVMTHFVDLCCSLLQNDPIQATRKMNAMTTVLDHDDVKWKVSGVCQIPITQRSGSPAISSFLDGIVRLDSERRPHLVLSFWPKQDVHALGYLLCGAVNAHLNSVTKKAEEYFKQAMNILRRMQSLIKLRNIF